MTNGGLHGRPPQNKPSPWPVTVGCLGAVFIVSVAAVLIAWISYS